MKLGYAIPREIRIRASANMGFIVRIGCGEFVAKTIPDLSIALEEYLHDPAKWEKEYNDAPGRKNMPDGEARPEPPRPRGTLAEAGTTRDEARG